MCWNIHRSMELIIVLAVLAVGASYVHEWRTVYHQKDHTPEMAQAFNQALWDEYGPGASDPYRELFGYPGAPSNEAMKQWGDPVNTALGGVRLPGNGNSLIAVPEAPDWFQKALAQVDIFEASANAVMENGPYLIAPDEEGFDDLQTFDLNLINVQTGAKGLRLIGIRDWLRGDPAKGIRHFSTVLRLADAFHPAPNLIHQLIRFAVYGIGLSGFELATWTDPSPEDTRRILECLEEAEPDTWYAPPHAESLLVTYLYTLNMLSPGMSPGERFLAQQFASGEALAAAILLGEEPSKDGETYRVLHEAGLVPREPLSTAEIADKLAQWTTLPAMRLRAERVPDSFFETDPFLSVEQAKEFPRLIYLASRYRERGFYTHKHSQRFNNRCVQGQTLLAAYRARAWHDEHGRWPSEEEFAGLVPESTSYEWHVTTSPLPIRRHFMAVHGFSEAQDSVLSAELNRNYCIGYTKVPKSIDEARVLGVYGVASRFRMGQDWMYDPETGNLLPRKTISRILAETRKRGTDNWMYDRKTRELLPTEKLIDKLEVSEMTQAAQRREGIGQDELVTRSVFLPRPPESLPAALAGPTPDSTYEITAVRKPPQADATFVYPIPRDEAVNLPQSLGLGDVTLTTQEEFSAWYRATFQAFGPLVVSVTKVNPPPGPFGWDYTGYHGGMAYGVGMMGMGYGVGMMGMAYGMGVGGMGYGMGMVPVPTPTLPPVVRALLDGGKLDPYSVEVWQRAHPMARLPHLLVGLKYPKKSYWVTHPGPDGESDGLSVVYDPSNGITSQGDIVQLAGWDM